MGNRNCKRYVEEAWFWTEYWQEKEKEADREIELGLTISFESAGELIDHLNRLESE